MAVTMNEIAAKLGVSIATVSRVLSGSENSVSDEVRGSILETADSMGYRPRRRVGRTIAFLIDNVLFNLSSLFYASIISGVEKEVAARRFYFQFIAVQQADTPLNRLTIKFNDLAGAVLVGTYDVDFVRRLRSLRIPLVLVDYSVPTEDIDAVLVDNVDGIMRAGRHLATLGHARVAYISGTVDNVSSQERLYGFSRARAAYGFSEEPGLVEECPESISGGLEAMNRILDRSGRTPPTAVIAYNDMVAIGAINSIKQKGLSIPGDVSVVGFDDISLASEVSPPLTTVRVPKELMGRLAAEILFQDRQEQPLVPRKILLPPQLIIRASSAAPPRA
jgi:DNA-binding LacI/PurR family transcriptional regulator